MQAGPPWKDRDRAEDHRRRGSPALFLGMSLMLADIMPRG
jgi:hypothetical protein